MVVLDDSDVVARLVGIASEIDSDTAVHRVSLIRQLFAAGMSSRVIATVLPCVDVPGDLDGAEETFVYTGGAPTAIRIIEVVMAPGAGRGYRGTPMKRVAGPSEPVRDDSSFLGTPRAY